MLNFSFTESQRSFLVTALRIYKEELEVITSAPLSEYLRRGYRSEVYEVTGLLKTLSEAQDQPMSDEALRAGVRQFLKGGLKIEAIKFVRTHRSLGSLKEAKDFVDNLD